jgi:hypothetical protein
MNKQVFRHLTYPNVVSTLCLLLLVGGGTALAAGKLGKNSVGTKQIRNNSVTPAKLNPRAKATLKGATGAQGPKGEPGIPGSKGETGHGALEALPSGGRIHGTWVLAGFESAAATSPGFSIPASDPVDSEHVVVVGNDTEPGDGCTGNAVEPTAGAGFVCVYLAHAVNTVSAEGLGALGDPGVPQSGDGSRYGFMIVFSGKGYWFANGSWAYTAP